MKFDMETERLPPGRPKNWRKHTVIIACTATTVCILIVILYVNFGNVTREEFGRRAAALTTAVGDDVETLPEETENLKASQGIVEGILAGTDKGVVIISLDSLTQRTISSKDTTGVAFNWQSRKVHWIEFNVGIKIANLDGSSVELIISDTSYLFGLAVDRVTGNLYYGIRGSNSGIRVCDSMGKKCATVVSGVNNIGIYIWDIALFPSEGLMFWTSPYDKRETRANMDGTNLAAIFLEHIQGIFLHEFEEKIYWTNYYTKIIGNRDLNGHSLNVLFNITKYPDDIAVDGDTLYLSGHNPNGVYSVTSNRRVSTIANTAGYVDFYHLEPRNADAPLITLDLEEICDSQNCLKFLVERYALNLEKGLSKADRAHLRALHALVGKSPALAVRVPPVLG